MSLHRKFNSTFATSLWFKSVWEFMSTCQMHTSITNFVLRIPVSSQDEALMDIAFAMKMRIPFQFHQLNIVRIILKLSDIFCEACNAVKKNLIEIQKSPQSAPTLGPPHVHPKWRRKYGLSFCSV